MQKPILLFVELMDRFRGRYVKCNIYSSQFIYGGDR